MLTAATRVVCTGGSPGGLRDAQWYESTSPGAGVKGGITYGSTDEFGYYAVDKKVHVHDLHATIRHLLGIDHRKLTYRFNGRDTRLTDVYGVPIPQIVA